MATIGDRVKIIHASDLASWTRFPEYRDHHGSTLAEYRADRQAAETVLWELRDLVRARARLAELDVGALKEYACHTIPVPRSIGYGRSEILLPEPEHPASTITCDRGEVSGQVLRLPRSLRKQTVTARYACPSQVLNAIEIATLKASLSSADPKAAARLAEAEASRYRQPLLFISHRWEQKQHPDPEGQQLANLGTLKDCFFIYDYTSFHRIRLLPKTKRRCWRLCPG